MRFLVSVFLLMGLAVGQAHAADSKATDLVVFPSQGGVQVQVRGTGAYGSTKAGETVQGKKRMHAYSAEVMYGVHDYFAAGVDLRGSMGASMFGAAADNKFNNEVRVQRILKPSIVVAGNLMGANNAEPVSAVLKVRFAPKWVSTAAAAKARTTVEGEMADVKLPQEEGKDVAFPKTNDIEVGLDASYAINSDLSVGVNLVYAKVMASKEDKDKMMALATPTPDAAAAARKGIIAPDFMGAVLRAQYGIQEKAYVQAGAMYYQKMGEAGVGKFYARGLDKGIKVIAGVAVPVTDGVAIKAGGSYQLWSKTNMGEAAAGTTPASAADADNKPKTGMIGWRAGLVAQF